MPTSPPQAASAPVPPSGSEPHLREVTADDIKAALDRLRIYQLRTTTVAVWSLFRFANKRGLIFANPAARLKATDPRGSLPPMTDAEIRGVEWATISPAQRLIVALAAIRTCASALDLGDRGSQRVVDVARLRPQEWRLSSGMAEDRNLTGLSFTPGSRLAGECGGYPNWRCPEAWRIALTKRPTLRPSMPKRMLRLAPASPTGLPLVSARPSHPSWRARQPPGRRRRLPSRSPPSQLRGR